MATRMGRVTVAVSEARAALRGAQESLNSYLWSSELAYGFVLTSTDQRLSVDRPVSARLADVESLAWYPNHQGSLHYDPKVSRFKKHLSGNTLFVYRAVLLSWYAYFESYLEARVRAYIKKDQRWGPFTQSLSIDALRRAAC